MNIPDRPKLPRGARPTDPAKRRDYDRRKAEAIAAIEAWDAQYGQNIVVGPSRTSAHVPQTVVSKESTEEIVERIAKRFEVMGNVVEGAAKGDYRATIVAGAAGMGKTTDIVEMLQVCAEQYGTKFVHLKGEKMSPISLYIEAYKNRHEGTVLVLDDMDRLFKNPDGVALLKAMLDSTPTRKVSYGTLSGALKKQEIPKSHEFKASVIFITNADMQREVDIGRGERAEHLAAVLNRVYYVDLKVHTLQERVAWLNYVIPKKKILQKHGLNAEQIKELLKYMSDNAARFRSLSIRTATLAAATMRSTGKGWKEAAEVTLMR